MSTLVSSVILLLNYISCSWMTWLAVKKPTKIAKNNRCESSLWRTSSCEPSLRGKKCRLTLGKSTRKGQDLEPLGLPSRAASPEWAFGKVLRSQMQLSSYWWRTSWPGSVRSASEIHSYARCPLCVPWEACPMNVTAKIPLRGTYGSAWGQKRWRALPRSLQGCVSDFPGQASVII